jgi:hypothetical protein
MFTRQVKKNIGFLILLATLILPGEVLLSGEMEIIGKLAGGRSYDVVVIGDWLYSASGAMGLCIYDVKDPTNPILIGYCDTPGCARSIAVVENYVYVADRKGGLRVIDVSNKKYPQEIGYCKLPNDAHMVITKGKYAYVTFAQSRSYYASRLAIIDITKPKTPEIVKDIRIRGHKWEEARIKDMEAVGNYVYLANMYRGLCIIDVSVPNEAKEVKRIYKDKPVFGVTVGEGQAYVVLGSSIRILDVSDPGNPLERSKIDIDFIENRGISKDVLGNYIYISNLDSNYERVVQILDISDKERPKVVGSFPGIAQGMDIKGSYAYVPEGKGFQIIDISNPKNPYKMGEFKTPVGVRNIAVKDNYAYLVGLEFLEVIDIRNPQVPLKINTSDVGLDSWNYPEEVAISGNYVYIFSEVIYGEGSNLTIVDVSNPVTPRKVGEITFRAHPGSDCGGGVVKGDYAYMTTGQGLYVIDVSNRESPKKVKLVSIGCWRGEIISYNNYLYICDRWDKGINIVDISDPENPIKLGYYDTSGKLPGNIMLVDNYLYVEVRNVRTYNLEIVDISISQSPQKVNELENFSYSRGMEREGNYAYFYNKGIQVFDVSNPREPQKLSDSFETPGKIWDIVVVDSLIYLADRGTGLWILKHSGQRINSLSNFSTKKTISSYPNPFNPECWIPVENVGDENLRPSQKVKIYNILGQLVREIECPRFNVQSSRVYWDGRDSRGLEVPAGVYFYEVAGQSVRKMVVLR